MSDKDIVDQLQRMFAADQLASALAASLGNRIVAPDHLGLIARLGERFANVDPFARKAAVEPTDAVIGNPVGNHRIERSAIHHAGTATFLLSHAFWQGEQTILFG